MVLIMFKHIFDYANFNKFKFEELPKGFVFELSMNPYNGKVFFKREKHRSSSRISLELMREIVRACDVMERRGSNDPLNDVLDLCSGENWADLFNGSDGLEIRAEKGRRKRNEKIGTDARVKKAS